METPEFWRLARVSDERLRSGLTELLANGYCTEARIIAHIAEVEQRKLHLRDGSESLFHYCPVRLGLSNSEAFHRITAARIARHFPIVFTLIEKRELHLTAVCLLRDYIRADNHLELLAEARHKTKFQIQEMLARRFPRPDVESRIRKLPARAVSLAPAPQPAGRDSSSVTMAVPNAAAPPQPAREACAPPSMAAPNAVPPPRVRGESGPVTTATPKTMVHSPGQGVPARGVIQPISEARYRIQLNASSALKEKLELLRALTSHANASGDLAVVIERAVDLALEQVQRERFAKTERSRTQGPRRLSKSARSMLRRGHIPNAVQRAVAERDGTRCTYVGEGGHRCTARAFLQIHHDHAWARGGTDDVQNLRMLCSGHNGLLAEQDFGAKHIAEQIAARRLHPVPGL